ncbi:MAG: glycosyltransferase [Lachnospiraceae bacterium]|jgi:glycosyltransferase involved in cell wall biosynthesis|nr:glycosyltransferase [Lachnospiraceae bacterium]
MRPQLTISLLASNHINSVRRCLDSLVPILMQIPSELIVVNTSGRDSIRNLVLQYTDHVVPFQWCDDFAQARNAGLREAQGEWFMFIDDDEWLDTADEIIAFFSSGECERYNSGTYQVRNYKNWSGTDYVDAYVARMVRLTPASRFIGTIHEYIEPYKGPVKQFTLYAHHYGYVHSNTDMKTLRNVPLLEKEMEKKAFTAHNYLQLCQEYMADLQFEKAEAYALKCLEVEEKDKEKEKSWCLAYLPYLINKQGDHQRAYEAGKRMLRHPCCTELASLRIYMDQISVCEKMGGHDKDIIVYARSYHDGISHLDMRPEEWFRQAMGALGEQQIKAGEQIIYRAGLQAAVRIKDEKAADIFLQWFPWGREEIEGFYPSFYVMLQDKDNGGFVFERFAGSELEDPFVFLVKAQAAWKEGDLGLAEKFYEACASSSNGIVLQEAVLLALRSSRQISLKPLMGRMDMERWIRISDYAASQAQLDGTEEWIRMAEDYLTDFPVQALLLMIVLQERLMIEGVAEVSDCDLVLKMEQYCGWVMRYTSLVYSEYVYKTGNISLLPERCRFAQEMECVFQGLQEADPEKVLQGLQRAVNIYRPLCGAVRRMLPIIEERLSRTEQSEEFERLGAQVKQMIKDLIGENRYIDAFPLIQQLSSLLPKDLEVVRLRQKLWQCFGE